ncbi:sigma-70 family RNA polymerase sigma factor [Pedobacter cryoconitis]|uniref:RNA polymerase sigma-70 factor (ECF subfamily) n=1 Tax=Pedobacter cryoconitis TaxID=188932 RepID=A0A327SHJ2_9SPHI|nr:sigma-70 family RNA polymerase sigma factor [Pedobacter cryoconitis]RAJ28549.1 RNA polymerase sigma-70 factor (ECF subfamily) [Pedobacter cryoconitis]
MKYNSLSDNSLVDLLKDSDGLAFKEIYTRYWAGIYKAAYVKVYHKELAEELTQNLFADLWRRRESITINTLDCYLFGSLKYSIINHYKSQLVKEKYQDHVTGQRQHITSSTDDLALVNDLSKALNQGIALLPKKTGEVFKLSRIDNRSTKEISQQLNISEKAVEYHITQSLKSMRFHLKEYLFLFLSFLLFHKF